MLKKIVSGGQTGADRAALDWAIAHKIPHGGWCPKGRKAEDGIIPDRYHLRETESEEYHQRTEQNVIDSDATAIFSAKPELTGGSKLTADFAATYGKPVIHIHPGLDGAAEMLARFISEHRIEILNIAGPRAFEESEIYRYVTTILNETIYH